MIQRLTYSVILVIFVINDILDQDLFVYHLQVRELSRSIIIVIIQNDFDSGIDYKNLRKSLDFIGVKCQNICWLEMICSK